MLTELLQREQCPYQNHDNLLFILPKEYLHILQCSFRGMQADKIRKKINSTWGRE